MSKKEKTPLGICAICRKKKMLTYEHIPPKSAFNDIPINYQNDNHLLPINNPFLYQKKGLKRKGYGLNTLCKACNSYLVGHYVEAYTEFAHQGMYTLFGRQKETRINQFNFNIKPLNVLKQIVGMFLSADHSVGSIAAYENVKEFVLDKHTKELPDNINVFMYSTLSSIHRVIGLVSYAGSNIMKNGNFVFCKFAEINFKPFGFILAIDSPKPHTEMVDITFFNSYSYNEMASIDLMLPLLNIDDDIKLAIGSYI